MISYLRANLHRQRARSLVWTALFAALALIAVSTAKSRAQDEEAQRVLAIGGAVTEIVYALGEEDRLVARDSTSTFPPQAVDLPDVGYMRALSPEGVLSVKPDLILARANSGPDEAIEVLQAAQVRWVTVPDDFTPEGIDENIRIIADALGVPDKGEALRQRLAEDLSAARATTAGIDAPKRVLFVLSMRDDRIMASGTGTAAHGIIELAGADNVIGDFQGYKQLADEAVISADPDVILMMQGRGEAEDHGAPNARITGHPALGATRAAREGAIIRMDGLYLLGFGPRTGEAAQELARAIYGDQLR
ncbi:heme/hemin ABC transporter substrate-binding protein [Oceaniradius stylonematis]|uniref:heme/hemin ABC transporter substrate-binding protein n=1 Tax=Oceaniradius stylonematis TaxID=2184161 RepID=UPI00273F6AD4|nr:ABC transporter substrate-binding protein [Oceaniradius stylonematis]